MAHRLLNTFLQENDPLFFALLNFYKGRKILLGYLSKDFVDDLD